MKRLFPLPLILFAFLIFSGCVTQEQIREGQAFVNKWDERVAELQEKLDGAIADKLDAEYVLAIQEHLSNAREMAQEGRETLARLQEGDPWWVFGLKIVAGVAGAASIYEPRLRAVKRGLDGAVRFADGLKKTTNVPSEKVKEIAAMTVNDNEQAAIEAARKRGGV